MCLQKVCYPGHKTPHLPAPYSHLQTCKKRSRVVAEMCHRRRTRKTQRAAGGLAQEHHRYGETGQISRDGGHRQPSPLWRDLCSAKEDHEDHPGFKKRSPFFFISCLPKLPISDRFLTSCKHFSCTTPCSTNPADSLHILWRTTSFLYFFNLPLHSFMWCLCGLVLEGSLPQREFFLIDF